MECTTITSTGDVVRDTVGLADALSNPENAIQHTSWWLGKRALALTVRRVWVQCVRYSPLRLIGRHTCHSSRCQPARAPAAERERHSCESHVVRHSAVPARMTQRRTRCVNDCREARLRLTSQLLAWKSLVVCGPQRVTPHLEEFMSTARLVGLSVRGGLRLRKPPTFIDAHHSRKLALAHLSS